MTPPRPRRQPTQQRSRLIADAIVQAARKLLTEQGPEAFTTNRVAEVAGVNIASLYRWFPNKEAIIESAFEAVVNEEIAEIMELVAREGGLEARVNGESPLEDAIAFIVEPLIRRQLRFVALHPAFYRAHLSEFDLGRRSVLDTEQTWMEVACDWVAAVIGRHHPHYSAEACAFRAFMLTRTIQGACQAAATDRPELLTQPRFREELYALGRFALRP